MELHIMSHMGCLISFRQLEISGSITCDVILLNDENMLIKIQLKVVQFIVQ